MKALALVCASIATVAYGASMRYLLDTGRWFVAAIPVSTALILSIRWYAYLSVQEYKRSIGRE